MLFEINHLSITTMVKSASMFARTTIVATAALCCVGFVAGNVDMAVNKPKFGVCMHASCMCTLYVFCTWHANYSATFMACMC